MMNISFISKEPVSFDEVMEAYLRDHSVKDDWWEKRNLERANVKFGSWFLVRIPISEVGKIVMPCHIAEEYPEGREKEATLVPFEGLTLAETYERFKQVEEMYKVVASECYLRVLDQKKEIIINGMRSIFLSQEPLFVGTSYSGLTNFEGMITHLDGFHRLVALMCLDEKPEFIEAYLAAN